MTEPTTPEPSADATAPQPPPVQEQREELAETVGALAEKLDVPTRVKSAASDSAHIAQVKAKDNSRTLLISGLAGVGLIGALIVIRRRRSC